MQVKRKAASQKGLTPLMVENLIHGSNLLYGYKAFQTEKQRRDIWEKHGDYILETFRDRVSCKDDGTFLALSFPSGSRPEAWWRYDNKCGMRKVLQGDPKPMSDEFCFGKHSLTLEYDPTLKYETQFNFLERHALLFEGEKDAYLKRLHHQDQERNFRLEKIKEGEKRNSSKILKFQKKGE